MTDTDLSDWLPIVDAAKAIGCSTRTIERLGRAKKLEQRLRPQAGSPAVAVYNPDDVARLASERRPAAAPFVLPAVQTPNGNGHQAPTALSRNRDTQPLASDDPIRQFFVTLIRAIQSPPMSATQSPPSPPVAETVAETRVLTLDEAVAASGWTRAYLLRKIHNGTLNAEKDRGRKIRRKDLEAL